MRYVNRICFMALVLVAVLALVAGPAAAQQKPNIVIIWGDDIGQSNVSAYSHGLMGYKTPNVDRVAKEGAGRSSTDASLLPPPL
jgi:hypothetical protein